MRIGVAIPTLNRKDLLAEALVQLRRYERMFHEIMVIDNGYQDLDELCDGITLETQDVNLGFGGAANFAIRSLLTCRLATGEPSWRRCDWLLFHSDDVVLSDESLAGMRALCRANANKWLIHNRDLSFSVFLLSRAGAVAMEYQPGMFFDEEFWPGDFEDADFVWRIKLMDKSKLIEHSQGLQAKVYRRKATKHRMPGFREQRIKNREYFIRKWGHLHDEDRRYKTPFNREA